MKRMFSLALACALHLFLTGCVTQPPRLQRDTAVLISLTDGDVLVSGIGPDVSKNFSKQVLKQVTDGLDSRGVRHESTALGKNEHAKLTIDLVGIQAEGKLDVGFASAETKQLFRARYVATLVSPEGIQLFRLEIREASELFAELPGKVGQYIAKRVAAEYTESKHWSVGH